MADLSHSVSSVAQRYAASLFELAKEEDKIDAVGADLDQIDKMLKDSDDFRRLVMSPAFSADEQLRAVKAILEKARSAAMSAISSRSWRKIAVCLSCRA